ncbi:MAG: dihydropteroate synthase [Planctomycetota bacterium]
MSSAAGGVLVARMHRFVWGGGAAPILMAVVNTTPDSFSDGGLHLSEEAAIAHGKQCIRDGAGILDIGGESTRPGAISVSPAEQIFRTHAAIAAFATHTPVSIDTTDAEVARAAFAAGACIVNDVSAATDDPSIVDAACACGAAIVLMHRLVSPDSDRWSTEHDSRRTYQDVVHDVRDWLGARIDAVVRAGMSRERIAIDPGLGFGKDVQQNLALIARLGEFAELGVPVLVGASRKSFLGAITAETDPARRDAASVAAALVAASNGAAILRVHAVRDHAHALATWSALRRKD